jgi:3-methyladenine DNA glycosylase AlkD
LTGTKFIGNWQTFHSSPLRRNLGKNKPWPTQAASATVSRCIKRIDMPVARKKASAKTIKASPSRGNPTLAQAEALLRSKASEKYRLGMLRFALPNHNAIGVAVGDIRKIAKHLGRSHALAADLWKAGWYEARMLACFVDDPAEVTSQQMDRWCKDFDNWGICDTACFALFDRTEFRWAKIKQWARSKDEFVKRAAFAMIACLTVHDKQAEDDLFIDCLPLIERASDDDRNFVKKAVNWSLRSVGKRSRTLHAMSLEVAQRLADSTDAATRWIGKDALRELKGASVARRLAKKARS